MSVVEVLCHEMRPADILKIKAESNNANTGGGARDLRFRLEFAPCLDRFFLTSPFTKDGLLTKSASSNISVLTGCVP